MPNSVDMFFSVGQATHSGLVRDKNEDSFGWFSFPNGELFIVADGMGGYAGGAEASKRTVISFKEYFESHEGPPTKILEESLLYADSKVQEIGHINPDLSNCGSTIVALFISGNTGFFIHAGDSRLYMFTRGRLHQIGHDHSAVQDMLLAGVISKEEAKRSPKNVITQSLGGNIDISRCTVEQFKIVSGSSFLLCSDGLWGPVSEDKLITVLSSQASSSSKVNKMIEAAIDAGGPDNITAQLIEFGTIESQTHLVQRKTTRKLFFTIISLGLIILASFGYFAYKRSFGTSGLQLEIPAANKQKSQQPKQPAFEENSDLATEDKNKAQLPYGTEDPDKNLRIR